MRKGLSVLLIAAALFGFYGGAVNLNDVLACKDYWEVKGEETTADMNKLTLMVSMQSRMARKPLQRVKQIMQLVRLSLQKVKQTMQQHRRSWQTVRQR